MSQINPPLGPKDGVEIFQAWENFRGQNGGSKAALSHLSQDEKVALEHVVDYLKHHPAVLKGNTTDAPLGIDASVKEKLLSRFKVSTTSKAIDPQKLSAKVSRAYKAVHGSIARAKKRDIALNITFLYQKKEYVPSEEVKGLLESPLLKDKMPSELKQKEVREAIAKLELPHRRILNDAVQACITKGGLENIGKDKLERELKKAFLKGPSREERRLISKSGLVESIGAFAFRNIRTNSPLGKTSKLYIDRLQKDIGVASAHLSETRKNLEERLISLAKGGGDISAFKEQVSAYRQEAESLSIKFDNYERKLKRLALAPYWAGATAGAMKDHITLLQKDLSVALALEGKLDDPSFKEALKDRPLLKALKETRALDLPTVKVELERVKGLDSHLEEFARYSMKKGFPIGAVVLAEHKLVNGDWSADKIDEIFGQTRTLTDDAIKLSKKFRSPLVHIPGKIFRKDAKQLQAQVYLKAYGASVSSKLSSSTLENRAKEAIDSYKKMDPKDPTTGLWVLLANGVPGAKEALIDMISREDPVPIRHQVILLGVMMTENLADKAYMDKFSAKLTDPHIRSFFDSVVSSGTTTYTLSTKEGEFREKDARQVIKVALSFLQNQKAQVGIVGDEAVKGLSKGSELDARLSDLDARLTALM